MDYKLKRYGRTALLAVVWIPLHAFPVQLDAPAPAIKETETTPLDSVEPEVDLAFIEFLGQWETDEGEWLPPSDLADEAFVELIETVGSLEIEAID